MIKNFINWIKSLFLKKEESVVLEETPATESTVQHCGDHNRFRKNCPDCLRAVGVI